MFAEVHIFTLSILHQFPQQQKRNFQRKIQLPKKEKVMGFSDWIEWKKKKEKKITLTVNSWMDFSVTDWVAPIFLCVMKKNMGFPYFEYPEEAVDAMSLSYPPSMSNKWVKTH